MLNEHGKEFIEVAERLVHEGNRGEAYLRSAISRAYYAVFNYISFVLRQSSVRLPSTGKAHVKLPQCLQSCRNDNLHLIGTYINDLKRSRTKADYEMGLSINRTRTQDAISNAKMVISNFNIYFEQLDPNEKNDILDKMKRYLLENPS